MLDLLTLDHNGRLAVIELKADEDLHLPMQALDYWIRVRALKDDRQPSAGGRPLTAFERQGYFGGAEVSTLDPRLLLVARRCGSIRERAGAALLLAKSGVGADRSERTLAARTEGRVPEAEHRRAKEPRQLLIGRREFCFIHRA